MIIFVVGPPRSGKTSWLQQKIEEIYRDHGYELHRACCKEIDRLNQNREIKLNYPEKNMPPIYAPREMSVKFRIRRDKYFEPFILNPYLLSQTNQELPPQSFLPYGRLFIPEGQKYLNSRQHQSRDPGVYRLFEIHGHNKLDIYIDCHVGTFIDVRIRSLVGKVIEIVKQTNIYDSLGGVIHTTWNCREFDCLQDYDEYYNNHDIKKYKETTYEYEGDIFKHYNSFGCQNELVPPEGQQFSMLKPLTDAEIKALPPEEAIYYSINEPTGYRRKSNQKTSKENKDAKRSA